VINFRFHLVSLVAVFLALALGVVMGSTVIDRAIVDGLKSRINDVEERADARRTENIELKRRLDGLEAYVEEAVPHLVAGRLERVPVAVAAVRGVDGGMVRSAVDTLRSAGAIVPGVVWMEPALALADGDEGALLAEALGDPFNLGDALRGVAIEALGRRLATGPGTSADAEALPSEDLLVALETSGFLAFDAAGGPEVDLTNYPPADSRLLVIDGSQGRLPPALAALPLVRALADAGAQVTLAEVFRPSDAGAPRGSVVRGVRNDRTLATQVATVDHLDQSRGRAALALAFEELGRGRAGHYGEGPGASRQLPEAPPPEPVPAASVRRR